MPKYKRKPRCSKVLFDEDRRITKILDRAWYYQSRFIRVTERGICRTCGAQNLPLSLKVNAGHMIHTSRGFNVIDFNYTLKKLKLPPNIYCQCVTCNKYGNGEGDKMLRKFLADGHTLRQYDRMEILKMKVWKPTYDEALEVKAYYLNACKDAGVEL